MDCKTVNDKTIVVGVCNDCKHKGAGALVLLMTAIFLLVFYPIPSPPLFFSEI